MGNIIEIWESDHTRPPQTVPSESLRRAVLDTFESAFAPCMQHPFLPVGHIRQEQLERIKELVELAYRDIPVYKDKYRAAGFTPSDLRGWQDIRRIPPITKAELIAAFPGRCLHPRFDASQLYRTRSSGSSGHTLPIRVDLQAIALDTVQGVRQFALQSGLRYQPDHLIAHIYTVPWWIGSIGEQFRSAFISGLLPPLAVARYLHDLEPRIVSCYPTNLQSLLPYAHEFARQDFRLAVVHSEQSPPTARRAWSDQLGVPVRDEYSSEEATRIALELPCGHYHVCEDTVHLEVLHPGTMQPQTPGCPGLAVVTNLLNEAMPFIRYVQGDVVSQPAAPSPCAIQWSQLASIDGRANDMFVNAHGREVPAGSILDLTYRWMYDSGVNLREFELVQVAPDRVRARFVPYPDVSEAQVQSSVRHLEELLELCLEHPLRLDAAVGGLPTSKAGKRRPIRRGF